MEKCQIKTKGGAECDKPVCYVLSNGLYSCKLHSRNDVTKQIILVDEKDQLKSQLKENKRKHKESIRLFARENIEHDRSGDVILTRMNHFEKTPLKEGYLNVFLDDCKRNKSMGMKFPDLQLLDIQGLITSCEDNHKQTCNDYMSRIIITQSYVTLEGLITKGINIQILGYKVQNITRNTTDEILKNSFNEKEIVAESILYCILSGKEYIWNGLGGISS